MFLGMIKGAAQVCERRYLRLFGQVAAAIFDGNIQSLPWRFMYDDTVGRATSVDVRGIMEALRKIYKADDLVKELTRKPEKKN